MKEPLDGFVAFLPQVIQQRRRLPARALQQAIDPLGAGRGVGRPAQLPPQLTQQQALLAVAVQDDHLQQVQQGLHQPAVQRLAQPPQHRPHKAITQLAEHLRLMDRRLTRRPVLLMLSHGRPPVAGVFANITITGGLRLRNPAL